ncbi:MAG: DUF3311 domain-containing protein [Acidithiobacillus sp.]|uniref:DUF3311 domain-containing protein n=1 Tax=Acidithiobacillus sp. TaxID=1872118 RepID=UPI003D004185
MSEMAYRNGSFVTMEPDLHGPADTMTESTHPHHPKRLRWPDILLLAIPCVAVLIVPFYNRVEPRLWGIPFFYWWQLMWVPLCSVFLGLVYLRLRRRRAGS